MAHEVKDRTALIPFVIFVILAGVVTYSIVKGTRKNKVQRMEEDVLYITPASGL